MKVPTGEPPDGSQSGSRQVVRRKLRLGGLADIDPLALPLPNGTEVSIRVDRMVGDRRLPQGAVGRVVAQREGQFDVHVLGVGVVSYARTELLPRKAGQMRFAHRREAAWAALRPCVILEATVGSHAWGLADESSDVDQRGVFALPFPWTQGLVDPPRDLVSSDGSSAYWECGKAVRQALRADPNTLELLFLPGARALDRIGEWLLAERDAFASAEIYGSFGRYALSQLKKLEHSMRLAEHRADVLDWLRGDPPPDLDEVAARLARLSPRAAPTAADAELQAKEYVKHLYRSLHERGLLASRDFASLVTFARTRAPDLDLPRELRPKNAYNLLRLIGCALHWLRTGAPSFVPEGHFRDRLLAIKRGEVPLADVLRMADELMPELEAARQSTPLPRRADPTRADALLRRIGEELARRHLERAPGPFGRDAMEPPEATWEPEPEP